MIKRQQINFSDFNSKPISLIKDWMLLTSGDFNESYNSMTIAWGSIGDMWHLPVFIIGVRPERYTYEFTKKYSSFTVCTFSSEYKNTLSIMGSKSGREIDKMNIPGLTPITSKSIKAPGYEEAELIIECEIIYKDDLKKEFSCQPVLDFYKDRNYHRMYIGQIKTIMGTNKYVR